MDRSAGIGVAVVGLGFGAEFVPIYRDHPHVGNLVACDADGALLSEVATAARPDRATTRLDDVLEDPAIDAVHLVTGIPSHAELTVRALEAGKHVACTVPMALTLAELDAVVDACERTGRRYMMMETAVYGREFFLARSMMERGAFGTVVHARGTHFQDMTGWPAYWHGLPPMAYATHAISPILALLDTEASRVQALGSGRLRADQRGRYENPFPLETALVELAGRDVVVDLTRSLVSTARGYTESFSVYGDRRSFEWPQLEGELPVVFSMGEPELDRGRPVEAERPEPPDRLDLLPEPLHRYTRALVHDSEDHLSVVQGGGHGGSHPHLVHEFVSSIVEERAPYVDHRRAAAWTAVGIVAHESAMAGGSPLTVPSYLGARA
ncbi:oxidoreductase domain protein [Beutenbergia cavernae DSM 12333]|uniref:Oxidoreductase domain protein n=1 Tax=Beutenbergia cavernae (strain ATCC BAA-8 / DSM 12333 / CCUG 43141 / JCM 11478 / NBRC 16432 / NCIMB 13614 / HKI 0122) TaxID=471853 RepID=C5C2N9_BEUC1|nr:Gfo/Idh/MocA family oxidoreductase [Beutenbergia cavernae]ACQ79725.1 oxidoreductase domain protein [Beutenbergia cavernae DSM 12333]